MRPIVLAFGLAVGAAVGLPWPGFFFFSRDVHVGNVEDVSDDVLSQRIRGKTALIVGGTDGIGRGIALSMARRGASVTVVGHSPTKAAYIMGNMSAIAKYPIEQKFHSYAVDLFTVKGVLNLTNTIKTAGVTFDYLVFTVGTWPDSKDPKTTDGVDKVIALDVLARFLITKELLASLNHGAKVMSVLASTIKVMVPPEPTVQTIQGVALQKTKYSLLQLLASSATLTDTWLQKMATENLNDILGRDISLIGTFPGVVADDLVGHSGTFPEWLRPILGMGVKLIGEKPEECGRLHTVILTSPNAARRPVSYFNIKLEGRYTSPLAYDLDFQDWVWDFLEQTVSNHTYSVERRGVSPQSTDVLVM